MGSTRRKEHQDEHPEAEDQILHGQLKCEWKAVDQRCRWQPDAPVGDQSRKYFSYIPVFSEVLSQPDERIAIVSPEIENDTIEKPNGGGIQDSVNKDFLQNGYEVRSISEGPRLGIIEEIYLETFVPPENRVTHQQSSQPSWYGFTEDDWKNDGKQSAEDHG